jgi:threonine/homoserine/homoserine lactone efflux protein
VSETAALLFYGFVLGWSVAWPPGPINAEMIRRGLAHGFRSAFPVGLGACSGDALWAIAVVLGAGLLIGPGSRWVLFGASSAFLLILAALYLRSAWHDWRARREASGGALSPPSPSAHGSYLLGLTMALTSPWNVAFWLAVIGSSGSAEGGLGKAFLVAGAVIAGAALWCLALCSATALLGIKFRGAVWQVIAKGVTGFLLLGFAVRGFLRFTAG